MKRLSVVIIVLFALFASAVQLGAAAAATTKQENCKVYDYTLADHKFRLVIPEDLAVVRGILLVGPYSGGDSRDYHEQAWYRQFLNLHSFAFLGAKDYYLQDYNELLNVLKKLASDTETPGVGGRAVRHDRLLRGRWVCKALDDDGT